MTAHRGSGGLGRGRWVGAVRALYRKNVAEELQYPANLLASAVGAMFTLGMTLMTLGVYFGQTDRVGGWAFWEVAVLLGVFSMLAGIVEAVLRPGIGNLGMLVRSGNLDLVLSRPVEPQTFVSFQTLALWRLVDVPIGLGLIVYGLIQLQVTPSAIQIAAFAVTLLSAVLILYSIWVMLMSLAFWFVAVDNLSVLFDAAFETARYPVAAFPRGARVVLLTLVPLAWTTTIPAATLTGRLDWAHAGGAIGVAALLFLLSRVMWSAGLRRYTGAGG